MSRKIGFWSVLALVTGSQIGSGVLMLPISLAPYGLLSLLGWLISGIGAISLALVFANLCAKYPRTGGPHAYVMETFGPTASFFTGWGYWIVSWISTPIVLTASVGYLSPLIGPFSPPVLLTLEISLLLAMTYINLRGVNTAGKAEFVLTLLKIIPLLIVPIAALTLFNKQNFAVPGGDNFSFSTAISHIVLLTLWGFIGVESATTPAGSVENPRKTIPKAVVWGTLCVAVLYFINSLGIMGAIPGEVLASSKAPYADATRLVFSGNWHLLISLIAAIVCIGTLNAWMLASGQIALGVAQDGLLPPFFAKQNKHGAPRNALLISCAGIIPVLVLTLSDNLAAQINAIIDFSVIAFLYVYLICTCAYLKLLWQGRPHTKIWQFSYALIALAFCLYVIASTPLKTHLFASVFLLSGLPIYLVQKGKLKAQPKNMAVSQAV